MSCYNLCRLLLSSILFIMACNDESRPIWNEEGFVRLQANPLWSLNKGERDTISLSFQIASKYHIMSDHPGNDLIPTRFSIEASSNLQFESASFPSPKLFKLVGTTTEIEVFEENMTIKLPVYIPLTTEKGNYHLKGILYYQACDDRKCFFPREYEFDIKVSVS